MSVHTLLEQSLEFVLGFLRFVRSALFRVFFGFLAGILGAAAGVFFGALAGFFRLLLGVGLGGARGVRLLLDRVLGLLLRGVRLLARVLRGLGGFEFSPFFRFLSHALGFRAGGGAVLLDLLLRFLRDSPGAAREVRDSHALE